MSFNLAVWDGPMPPNDDAATTEFNALYAKHFEEETSKPNAKITTFVTELLKKYPDLDDDNEEDCPWSDGPLINNASGPMFYFGMVYSKVDDTLPVVSALAAEHGLVCYVTEDESLERPSEPAKKPPAKKKPAKKPPAKKKPAKKAPAKKKPAKKKKR